MRNISYPYYIYMTSSLLSYGDPLTMSSGFFSRIAAFADALLVAGLRCPITAVSLCCAAIIKKVKSGQLNFQIPITQKIRDGRESQRERERSRIIALVDDSDDDE